MLRSMSSIELEPKQPTKPLGVTIDNKWIGRYEGVPRRAVLVHFSDRHTKNPNTYSCLTSNDPVTLMHYTAGSHAVLFASSLIDPWRVLHAFPGGVSMLMKRLPQGRITWRNMLLDESYYAPVSASINYPLPEFTYTIGRHLNRLQYPPILN